mmetsp:Transcript_5457/g.21580  ORF Transcript_5457/g.21580 Transcript_5457/m.21580 type:complete len:116 (+) Transcript_5457:65-412(+)
MKLSMVLLVLGAAVAQAFRPMSRQVALQKVAGIAGGLLLVPSVAKAELGPDGYPKMSSLEGPPQPKPKMSADEAECRYGQAGGKDWAAACKRWKSSGGEGYKSPGGKSPGGSYAM